MTTNRPLFEKTNLYQAEISNAWPVFCPALPAGSATIAPKTNEPTLTPSMMPVPFDMSMSIPTDDGSGGGWGSSSSYTGGPTVHASQVYVPEDDGHGYNHTEIFASSKGGKLESKMYKPHSKTGKSKSSKSKGGKSVDGKTGKHDDDWWGGAWNSGKVVGYDVTRNDARVASGVYGWGSVAVVVVSLATGALLMARQ